MRIEHDGLGSLEVPEGAYYGNVTERNRRALDISPKTLKNYIAYPKAIAKVKIACARANADIGALDPKKAAAIERAAQEIIDGKFDSEFPVCIYRGIGTPANMAVNEVIAHRANEILTGRKDSGGIHPNTHVNMGTSTNDVSPTAKEIVVYESLGGLIGRARHFEDVLSAKAEEFKDVVKMGRTGLQDAVPVTLGMEFRMYRDSVRRSVSRIEENRPHWNRSTMGGTAVGTGMGAMPGFKDAVNKRLSEVLGRPIVPEDDLLDGMTSTDSLVAAHGLIEALAVSVWHIARDLRIMASGPRAGFNEITLPAVAPGSSIMPGKVNPVIPEMIFLTCDQVVANHASLVAGTMTGWLELAGISSFPLMSIMDSCDLLGRSLTVFADKCVAGVTANKERCLAEVLQSTSLATLVSTLLGYEAGTRAARLALDKGITVKEAARELKVLPDEVLDELFDVKNMTDADRMEALLKKFGKYRKV